MKRLLSYGIGPFLVSGLLFMTSCGGSGGSTPQTATITGSVFAGPVSGAAVTVKNANGSTVAGPVSTDGDGAYTISVPAGALSDDLIVESSSGTFPDEASGLTTTASTLAAYVSGGTLTAGSVNLDPSSTIIRELITQHGKNAVEAGALFNTAFGYTPDTSVAPKNAPAQGADEPQRLAALRAIAFSQLTSDLALAPEKQFDLLAAIAQDLADNGQLNGSAGAVDGAPLPEDIQNCFGNSLASLLTNTAVNLTGLTPADAAPLPFSRVVLTDTYRVEYLPGMMPAAKGKTTFNIKLTKRSDGSAAPGLAVSLMPMMHMATMGHGAPVDAVVDNGDGTYTGTVYYLMGSGAGMGFWELNVMTGGETATFYPSVGMGMGSDTVRALLYGQDDIVSGMSGTRYNKYYLFRDALVSAATPTVALFIAHGENMNMHFVPVSGGSVLSSPTGTVTAAAVQASPDGGSTWLPATDNANGHWTVSGLTGLVSGQTATIYVRLNVNGQDKTTNGSAASGANAYATFTMTPL